MRKLHTRKGGFTLIELMIVVAIIGILAAIAIPNFLRFQLRSRVGEGKTNIAGIRTAEESYAAEYATYVNAAPLPAADAALSGDKLNWPAPVAGDGFSTIGWFPEGEVYYAYNIVAADNAGGLGCPQPMTPCVLYTVEGRSDIDDDNVLNYWGYVHAIPGTSSGIQSASGNCPATGVYNGVTLANDLLNTTGPCGAMDGQSIF